MNTCPNCMGQSISPHSIDPSAAYGIAIDIGTTSLAASLIALPEGTTVRTVTALNEGRRFGTDVIARIKAACNGHLQELQMQMQQDLTALISRLLSDELPAGSDAVKGISISANTTMLHILRGYSCDGLGAYPYTPVRLTAERLTRAEVLPQAKLLSPALPITLLPGFTTFVGADLLSGTHSLRVKPGSPPVFFLLDLGTNGEMVFVRNEKTFVCSTAAGPVFEGGGITCGVGGITGAIAHVRIFRAKTAAALPFRRNPIWHEVAISPDYALFYQTIADAPPIGFCGTGVLEMVAALVHAGISDADGLLKEPFFSEDIRIDSLRFTKQDVRAVQMAKAAISAGIATLLKAGGLPIPGGVYPDAVYVAGGYGQHMDFDAILPLDMIPKALLPLCISVGNSSLAGAAQLQKELYACSDEKEKEALLARFNDMAAQHTEVLLAKEPSFEQRYLTCMRFLA